MSSTTLKPKPPKASNFRLFDLNPQQEQAVRQIEGPVLILAGAGTGKTRVITARVAFIISQGISPSDILAVTFTNKAAREMKERLGGMIDEEEAKRVTMSTFHSLCVRILRQDIVHLGYKENFTIYDQGDQISLLRKIITRTAAGDEKLDANMANSLISSAKSEFGDPLNARVLLKNELLKEIFIKYQAELKRLNAVDFDDLLLLTVRLLMDNEERRAYWQNRFKYILVDEFQDTNRLQLELVARLAGTRPNVCAVGDDDQSIYSWRGADVTNILDFERHFPNPTIVKLEQNYRSTNAILSTANALIKNNPRRRVKNLWSDLGDGDKIRLIPLPDDKLEAEYVVNEIGRRSANDSIPYEKFAIIYRMNAQSRLMETNLRQQKIPYQLVGSKSFFDRREIKDFLAYLRVLVNPDDDISLLRILNTPPRGISDATSEKALQHSIAMGTSMFKALADDQLHRQLPAKASVAVTGFFKLLDDFETKLYAFQADYAAVTEEFLTTIGYWDDLRRSCKTSEEADERERNVKEMIESFKEFQQTKQGEPKEFLDTMTLDDDWMKNNKKDKEQKGVMLITMHAAKGLEFPHVYIIGLEEGVLPHSRSQLEGTVDEERRLFYVGITRAQRSLGLTYCLNRLKWGQAMPCHPSSFLRELPMEFIEAVDYKKVLDAPAEEKSAKGHFSRMRDMFKD